ncbi:hypothetical protein D3C81_2216340 [compost metagenome]
MGHAAGLGQAEFETGFVTTKIIADLFAPPVLQEVASVLSGSAGGDSESLAWKQARRLFVSKSH